MMRLGITNLALKDLMGSSTIANYYDDLDLILKKAWSILSDGVHRAASPYHIINVATLGSDLTPRIRSVVLRGFDETARTLRFHTDARSAKASEIARTKNLAVHLYAKNEKIQLRMACRGTVHNCDDVSREAWRLTKKMSRECYRQLEGPGTVVPSSDSVAFSDGNDSDTAYTNFAAVVATIETLEWLYLSASGHRRALFEWRGGSATRVWLAP
jgi:pyridoxamine 5'-phosphate oxidase